MTTFESPPKRLVVISVFGRVIRYLVVGLMGAAIATMLVGEHSSGLGLWLRDFLKASGFTPFAALIAASIAFIGISRQVAVSKENLELERGRERSRVWWQRFEWVSSEGLASEGSVPRLPVDVATNTLSKLLDEATSKVEREACSGVMDAISTRPRVFDTMESPVDGEGVARKSVGEPVHTPRPFSPKLEPGSDEEVSVSSRSNLQSGSESLLQSYEWSSASDAEFFDALEREANALKSWTEIANRTGARSSGAEARLYEVEVLGAVKAIAAEHHAGNLELRTAFGSKSDRLSGVFRPDAILVFNERAFAVEVKNFSDAGPLRSTIVTSAKRLRNRGFKLPVLFISSLDPGLSAAVQRDLGIVVVQWRGERDTPRLRAAISSLQILPACL